MHFPAAASAPSRHLMSRRGAHRRALFSFRVTSLITEKKNARAPELRTEPVASRRATKNNKQISSFNELKQKKNGLKKDLSRSIGSRSRSLSLGRAPNLSAPNVREDRAREEVRSVRHVDMSWKQRVVMSIAKSGQQFGTELASAFRSLTEQTCLSVSERTR